MVEYHDRCGSPDSGPVEAGVALLSHCKYNWCDAVAGYSRFSAIQIWEMPMCWIERVVVDEEERRAVSGRVYAGCRLLLLLLPVRLWVSMMRDDVRTREGLRWVWNPAAASASW